MVRISDLRERDVINIRDGRRIGYIDDVEMDLEKGRIQAVIIPGQPRYFGLFGRTADLVIPWNRVRTIGPDAILVEVETSLDIRSEYND